MKLNTELRYSPILLTVLLLLGFSPFAVFGCECSIPTVCQAFTRAEGIFIGKVTGVRTVKSGFIPHVLVDFTVEKRFKGESKALEVVEFEVSDCFDVTFVVGEQYFVYKNPKGSRTVCNRTDKVVNSAAEIDYAEKIVGNKNLRTIVGLIRGLSKKELKVAAVTIGTDKEQHFVKVDQHGSFTFSTDSGSDYVVRILLPFDATIYMKDLNVTFPDSGKSIEYALKLGPGDCNYREISVSKKMEAIQ